MKKKLFSVTYLLFLILLCSIIKYITIPIPEPTKFDRLPLETTTTVLPLDSRPPCTDFVSELGALASTQIILPPKAILGNYYDSAEPSLLYHWFQINNTQSDSAIISSDLLIHGGLIGSRLPRGQEIDLQRFEKFIKETRKQNPSEKLLVYSIIPRLLIADQLIPDSWWQWHLMRWAALQDIQDTFGDPISFQELQKFRNEIPQEIRDKYSTLYKNNDIFNHSLLQLAEKENINRLIIGQDDGQPFGLPNANRNHALFYIEHNNLTNKFAATRGADELGAVLLAADRNESWSYKPKVYVEYSSKQTPDLIMPFMSCSVDETVREKINIIKGEYVNSPQDADFILYVHCGTENFSAYHKAADRLKNLLALNIPVALVDLTSNYEAQETLLPYLIENDTPIVKLASYSAWNTTSNSVGTAISQASIFTGQLKRLPHNLLPALYAQNLNFNLERIFDDWVYQKVLHNNLKNILNLRYGQANDLSSNLPQASKFMLKELNLYKQTLISSNLNNYPFYSDAEKDYYLTDLKITASFPWERLFEINLSVTPSFGTLDKNPKH